jgi:hypothetical protein
MQAEPGVQCVPKQKLGDEIKKDPVAPASRRCGRRLKPVAKNKKKGFYPAVSEKK